MISFYVIFILLNIIIFFNLDRLSKFINIFDKPDNLLKKHKSIVPLIGGFILIINIFTYVILDLIFNLQYFDINISKREYFSLLFLILSFFLIGSYDDKYQIKPEKKFFLSILVSIIVITINKDMLINNISISFYNHIIYLNNFKYFFTIFCIIILINSLNFYDGINGQSIIFFIISFSFLAIKSSSPTIYILFICHLFFLLFLNLRNKIFLGDNGIYVLTIILSISLIYEHNVYKSIIFADEIFLLLFLPGLDLLRLTILRLMKGKNPFYGDRNHIHHLLVKNYSLIKSNFILFVLAIIPIVSFNILKLNFFLVISIFLIFYLTIILKLKKHGSF